MARSDTKALKNQLRRKAPAEKVDLNMGLSSGSTLLNLACTGNTNFAYLPGHYYLLVGDSQSGKTWLGHSALAEAAINNNFADYQLIFDDPEQGALMDVSRFFGPKLAGRLQAPAYSKENEPIHSERLEDFYFHVDDAAKAGPFVYLIDSLDALYAGDDETKFRQLKSATRKGKTDEASGSYGVAKAKLNSSHLRIAHNRVARTGSILLAIAQSRDRIGFGAQFDPKTRAGGNAPTFYATLEIWTSIHKKIKRKIKGKTRELGTLCKIRVRKNRVLGKDRTVLVPILHSHGIDDVGSMIQYLCDEGKWPCSKEPDGTVKELTCEDFDFQGTPEELAQQIEKEGEERDLRDITTGMWQQVETACAANRKNKYGGGETNHD